MSACRRAEKALQAVVVEAYVKGGSTRKVEADRAPHLPERLDVIMGAGPRGCHRFLT